MEFYYLPKKPKISFPTSSESYRGLMSRNLIIPTKSYETPSTQSYINLGFPHFCNANIPSAMERLNFDNPMYHSNSPPCLVENVHQQHLSQEGSSDGAFNLIIKAEGNNVASPLYSVEPMLMKSGVKPVQSMKNKKEKEKFNAYVNIIILNKDKDKIMSEEIFSVFYQNDHFEGETRNGKTHIEMNIENVIKWCPISKLRIIYLDPKNKVKGSEYIDINSNKLDLWVKSDKKYIIEFTFMVIHKRKFNDVFLKVEEKLKFKIKLIYGKRKQRERSEEDKDPKSGHYDKKNKITIIKEVLEILKKNNWDLFQECPLVMSELKNNPNFEKGYKKLLNALRKNEITSTENLKDLIIVIEGWNVADKEKNNLLILCFDIIYMSIILNFDNQNNVSSTSLNFENQSRANECIIGYIRLLKNYNIGNKKDNNDIIIEEENKGQKEDYDQCRKRSCPEENNGPKKQKMDSGNCSRQTNKKSDVDALLVDH